MEPEILSKNPMTPVQVADVLGQLNKKEMEPTQQRTFDLAKRYGKLTKAQTEKLIAELKSLEIARLTDEHVIEIVTILPESEDELKTIFAGSKTNIKPEDVTAISSKIKEYVKK